MLLVCMNGFRMNKKIKMVKVDLCINTMRWERAMLEEGAGQVHCPKTTWSLPGSGLHQQSHQELGLAVVVFRDRPRQACMLNVNAQLAFDA